MTRRSSIFSSESLPRLSRWPIGLIAALVLVSGAEGVARLGLSAGRLEPNKTLRDHVLERTRALGDERPDVWLVGNSTLDRGVDEAAFEEAAGVSAIKLSHGSATVRGSAAMLDYYARHVPVKPRALFVLVTIDDFNANGMRSRVSEEYLAIAATDRLPEPDRLALRGTRDSIRAGIGRVALAAFQRTVALVHSGGGTVAKREAERFGGAPIPPRDAWYASLVERFDFDVGALDALVEVAASHGMPLPTIVLLPVTDVYVEFHDAHCPVSYERWRRQLAEACRERGLALVDWGDCSTDYANFGDPYHLNEIGRRGLTARLAALAGAGEAGLDPAAGPG